METIVKENFENLIGKKVTMFKHSEFGFPSLMHCIIEKVYTKDYAQYKDLLHIQYKPFRKRTSYVIRIYSHTEMLVYADYIKLQADMYVSSETNHETGVIIRQGLLSFSSEYFDRALSSTTEKPLIHLDNGKLKTA